MPRAVPRRQRRYGSEQFGLVRPVGRSRAPPSSLTARGCPASLRCRSHGSPDRGRRTVRPEAAGARGARLPGPWPCAAAPLLRARPAGDRPGGGSRTVRAQSGLPTGPEKPETGAHTARTQRSRERRDAEKGRSASGRGGSPRVYGGRWVSVRPSRAIGPDAPALFIISEPPRPVPPAGPGTPPISMTRSTRSHGNCPDFISPADKRRDFSHTHHRISYSK